MSREIKFEYIFKHRYNNKITKECYSLSELEDFEMDIIALENSSDIITRRQYTGLQDKNGKEIYEGDILEGAYIGGGDYIFYCNETKEFHIGNQILARDLEAVYCYCCGGEFDMYEFRESLNEVEVIGNIYENPKLLCKD